MEEKRRHKRLDLKVQVELERIDTEDGITTLKYANVEVTNISRSGIGFCSKQKLEITSMYNAKIQIWTREVVDAIIQVVRREDMDGIYRYGGSFIGMTDKDALKIDIYQIFNEV